MLIGTLPSICVGLAFVFATVSLFVSSLTEALSTLLSLRSKALIDGLKALLNTGAQSADGGVFSKVLIPAKESGANATINENIQRLHDLLNHIAINPRGPGSGAGADLNKIAQPSYIDPKQFAPALLDVIGVKYTGGTLDVDEALAKIGDPQLRQLLKGIFDRSKGELAQVEKNLADWFDSSMDRLGGDFKRHMLVVNFLVGLTIAVVFNIDALHIAVAIANDPNLVEGIPDPKGARPRWTA